MERFLQAVSAANDETRVLILKFLSLHGKSCVCEFEASLGMIQSRLSRHLKILKDAGFLSVEKDGVLSYYFLDPKDETQKTLLEEIEKLDITVPKKICACDIKR